MDHLSRQRLRSGIADDHRGKRGRAGAQAPRRHHQRAGDVYTNTEDVLDHHAVGVAPFADDAVPHRRRQAGPVGQLVRQRLGDVDDRVSRQDQRRDQKDRRVFAHSSSRHDVERSTALEASSKGRHCRRFRPQLTNRRRRQLSQRDPQRPGDSRLVAISDPTRAPNPEVDRMEGDRGTSHHHSIVKVADLPPAFFQMLTQEILKSSHV